MEGMLTSNPRKPQKIKRVGSVWYPTAPATSDPCALHFPALAWNASLNLIGPSGGRSRRFKLKPISQEVSFLIPWSLSVRPKHQSPCSSGPIIECGIVSEDSVLTGCQRSPEVLFKYDIH